MNLQRYEKKLYFCKFKPISYFFMKKCLLLVFMLFILAAVNAQQTYTFVMRDTVALQMDVYQPQSPRADHACVVYMFGGGFVGGERNNKLSIECCKLLSERGFVAVAIDYRLYLKNPPKMNIFNAYAAFDTAIRYAVEDCSAAIAYLCAHADELHIDTSRIILTGSSAGAISVLQTDYCRANRMPAADALPSTFRPAAVIPYAGGIYCQVGNLCYATPPAPTCMFHGICDRLVNYNSFRGSLCTALYGSNRVAKVFRKNGYTHWVLRYEDRGHEIAAALPQTINEFCAFAESALSGRVVMYDAVCNDPAILPTKWGKVSLIGTYFHH